MRVSRWALGAWMNSMSPASTPSSLATYVATSTSNPVKSLPCFRPSPGWSYLMPTFRPSASESPPAPVSVSGSSEPHALSPSASTAAAATIIRRVVMGVPPVGGVNRGSVGEDLAEEFLAAVGRGVREELVGRRLLHDLAVGEEHHPVRHLAGETHLMGHDDHRHAAVGELDHDVEDLVDHLGVQGRGGLVEEHDLRVHRQ